MKTREVSRKHGTSDAMLYKRKAKYCATLLAIWAGFDQFIYSLSGSDCSAYSGHNSECDGLVTLKAVRAFY